MDLFSWGRRPEISICASAAADWCGRGRAAGYIFDSIIWGARGTRQGTAIREWILCRRGGAGRVGSLLRIFVDYVADRRNYSSALREGPGRPFRDETHGGKQPGRGRLQRVLL